MSSSLYNMWGSLPCAQGPSILPHAVWTPHLPSAPDLHDSSLNCQSAQHRGEAVLGAGGVVAAFAEETRTLGLIITGAPR